MTVALNVGANASDTKAAPEGHDKAMADKFDAAQQKTLEQTEQKTDATAQRPEHIPEKFWKDGKVDVDALAKSYAELERSRSQQKPADDQQQQTQQQQAPTVEAARDMVDKAGLDFDGMAREYAEKGELSAETYDRLVKGGIPKAVVDSFIAGQEAVAEQVRSTVFSAVGGEEKYAELTGWAAQNMSPQEIQAFNATMEGGSMEQMKFAVEALQRRFENAVGKQPQLLGGNSGHNSNSGDVFMSTAQLTAAMADKRYATDPAYRNEVIAKLGRSKIM
jgi:hypothetical protein